MLSRENSRKGQEDCLCFKESKVNKMKRNNWHWKTTAIVTINGWRLLGKSMSNINGGHFTWHATAWTTQLIWFSSISTGRSGYGSVKTSLQDGLVWFELSLNDQNYEENISDYKWQRRNGQKNGMEVLPSFFFPSLPIQIPFGPVSHSRWSLSQWWSGLSI